MRNRSVLFLIQSFQKVTYKMAQGGMMQDCSRTFPSGFPVLCGEACFSCVLPSPSTCRKKKIGQNKTKCCIVSDKLIFVNSPALHKGVLYSCRAVVVAIPVSVTIKAQIGTPAGSYVTFPNNTRVIKTQHNGSRISGKSQITVYVAKFIRLIFDTSLLKIILIKSLINITLQNHST